MLFAFQWLIIGLVAAWDVYLSIKFREDLLRSGELNPIGAYLLHLDNNQDVALFMGCKVAGTILVLGALILLYDRKRKWAYAVITPLFFFQVGLLFYLHTH